MTVLRARIDTRWADLDAQGHVNNAVVVDYLQQARVQAVLNSPNAGLLGHGIIIVAHRIEYLAPIGHDGTPLDAELRIGDLGAARFSFSYLLRQDGREVVRARTDACVFDFAAQRPRRLTDAERVWFEEVAEPLTGPDALDVPPGPEVARHPLAVRWSDLDAYGHVNNAMVPTYFGEARVVLNRTLEPSSLTSGAGGEASGMVLVVRQDLRYLGQITHRLAPYEVRTGFARVGRSSVTLAQRFVDPADGRVLATGNTVLVYAGRDGRPTAVPAPVRAAAEGGDGGIDPSAPRDPAADRAAPGSAG